MYTDISYSLADLGDKDIRDKIQEWFKTPDTNNMPLSKRILFGTDYYMTERETGETELYELAKTHLAEWFDEITRDNSEQYLSPSLG